ncbi:hypothetical protein ACN4EK_22645 [Pantanalinema rosaneae CENA516]|uniref:hypothetical protein n=1 Tax=Pantanalinema rosaneae TaxID=1620701 RepID=UPI003D6EFD98
MASRFFSTTIALTCLSALIGSPALAQTELRPIAQQNTQQNSAAPQIDSFTVEPVSQLSPGTELTFTLQGTPNSRASMTIGNLARNLPMREVEPGVYEGRYVIRTTDSLTADTVVRANLQRGDQITSARLPQSLTAATGTNTTQGAQSGNQSTQALAINSFSVDPVQQPDPGTVLNFTLTGTPNARATYSIEGITYNQPMQEVSQGNYRGQYVIRRQDDFSNVNNRVTASLQAGNQVARAQLDRNLFASSGTTNPNTTQLPLEVLSPQNNSRVGGTVEVRGRSLPNTTVDVNVEASTSLAGVVGLNRNVFNRTISTDAQGNFSFSFRPIVPVPGTRYNVSLSATNGNQRNEQSLVLIQQ